MCAFSKLSEGGQGSCVHFACGGPGDVMAGSQVLGLPWEQPFPIPRAPKPHGVAEG